MYAHVSFPISSFKVFTYKIPKSLIKNIKPGSCVLAPINKKKQVGFVIKLTNQLDFSGKILFIENFQDDRFDIPKELWTTLNWVAKYYISPIGRVLKTAIPHSFLNNIKIKTTKYVKHSLNISKKINLSDCKLGKSQEVLLKHLIKIQNAVSISSLNSIVSSPYSICRSLEKKQYVTIIKNTKEYNPFRFHTHEKEIKVKLSIEQKEIYNNIKKMPPGYNPILLHGVTGSGKTELYLKLAQNVIKGGKSVIVLVPEIALTPQVSNKFYTIFKNRVALWHSRMTIAEKNWTWKQLNKGVFSVVVGARSAIFSPIQNLGLIIVDEEHESSYKQETSSPIYNARDIALVRAQSANALVLLASATPSLESYYNALLKKYKLLKLNKRYGKSVSPIVRMVDMKTEMQSSHYPISIVLKEAIQECLIKSEQIILLHNRRGYALIYKCMECDYMFICEQCSITMTYHKTDNMLHCHYCESKYILDQKCNQCESINLNLVGYGTQHIQEHLIKIFPDIKIQRMDFDSVKKKGGHKQILKQFDKSDMLLGTQMIAKGLDFDNVTLVGIINADLGLLFPDFRSGERIFQQIYQVIGRSGRREKRGLAIIQTFNPNDVYIQAASGLNINKFYNLALAQRQELNYPPFSRLLRIMFSGMNKMNVLRVAQNIYSKLENIKTYTIIRPDFNPIEKINKNWRVQLVIKSNKNSQHSIHKLIYSKLGLATFEKKWLGVKIDIDIDPINMM